MQSPWFQESPHLLLHYLASKQSILVFCAGLLYKQSDFTTFTKRLNWCSHIYLPAPVVPNMQISSVYINVGEPGPTVCSGVIYSPWPQFTSLDECTLHTPKITMISKKTVKWGSKADFNGRCMQFKLGTCHMLRLQGKKKLENQGRLPFYANCIVQ